VVTIGSYEGPSNKSESVEERYPDIIPSVLRSAITTSRKAETPRNRFLNSGAVGKERDLAILEKGKCLYLDSMGK
jgi:hypothetical protein